jgi:hypothetical protein
MQLSAIRTETRNLLDDVDGDRWSNNDLDLYINQAQYDFNVLTQIYRGSVNINLTAGTSVYTVTGDDIIGPILRLDGYTTENVGDSVSATSQEKLDMLKPGWFSDAGTAIPKFFMRSKEDFKKFQIYPKSLTATPGGGGYPIIKVYAARVPTTLSTDVNVPVIPVEYHHALPYGAAARALQRNNDALSVQLAQSYDAKFKEYVATAQAIAKASFI